MCELYLPFIILFFRDIPHKLDGNWIRLIKVSRAFNVIEKWKGMKVQEERSTLLWIIVVCLYTLLQRRTFVFLNNGLSYVMVIFIANIHAIVNLFPMINGNVAHNCMTMYFNWLTDIQHSNGLFGYWSGMLKQIPINCFIHCTTIQPGLTEMPQSYLKLLP